MKFETKKERRLIMSSLIFYLDGEAGVERLEAALARIREAELERLPS
jgi:hypothetical protein